MRIQIALHPPIEVLYTCDPKYIYDLAVKNSEGRKKTVSWDKTLERESIASSVKLICIYPPAGAWK